MLDFKGKGEQIEGEIIAIRRHLHGNPELSEEEFETSQFIQQKLEEHEIPFKKGYAKTGVLGIIKGGQPGGVVALRADIDALPIKERTNEPFASNKEGVMHACGHDAHTAMLLGAGKLLNSQKEQIKGTVLLVFQPAEENAPNGGAQPMMDDGVFDEYTPDVIFGQHVWPDLPKGQIGIRDGAMMGASDRIKFTIKGTGGHASMPHQTNDAITIATTVINQLQTIVSRNVDPLSAAVLTIGKIEGGYRYNVIADEVLVDGTVRTLDKDTRERIKNRFYKIVEGTTEAMGGTAEIEFIKGYPATINTPEWAQHVRSTAQNLFGEKATPDLDPSLGGEDFSRFLLQYPGAFFWLGTKPKNSQPKPLHDPSFEIDEDALAGGVEMMAQVAADTLEKLENRL
ncbi:M20 family metallopeptidase [Alkalihalobacillus sp. TS-13]|uniref:M20 metallopeptidase family protein n=1 Tax=Alkalihalobacillus sp. TS-13 TaxID=2842455 RepID=UPI001C875A42|nr:M20 family metallopeptidase [Alkalihalobacillus sp. TS-13]